ncbi:MAG: hypothetical protein M0Z59_07130 [Nitrospiraceae bacterium]|nr:hypothetical protein [Nitrospiraceae bacterium]
MKRIILKALLALLLLQAAGCYYGYYEPPYHYGYYYPPVYIYPSLEFGYYSRPYHFRYGQRFYRPYYYPFHHRWHR